MREVITVNGIDCDVEYNTLLYSKSEIKSMLRDGLKDKAKLDDYLSEFDLHNYDEVVKHIKPKKLETKVLDLTSHVKFVTDVLGQPRENVADELKDYGFTEVKDLGDNKFELTGGRGAFTFLKQFTGII